MRAATMDPGRTAYLASAASFETKASPLMNDMFSLLQISRSIEPGE